MFVLLEIVMNMILVYTVKRILKVSDNTTSKSQVIDREGWSDISLYLDPWKIRDMGGGGMGEGDN